MDKVEQDAAAFGDEGSINIDDIAAGETKVSEANIDTADKGDTAALFDDSVVDEGKKQPRSADGKFAEKPKSEIDEEAEAAARGDTLEDPEADAAAAAAAAAATTEAEKPTPTEAEKPDLDAKGREIPKMVPRDRMTREAERRRAAEHQLEIQTRSSQLASNLVELQTTLEAAEAKEIQAMKDGDFDSLPALRREVDAVRAKMADLRADDIADRKANERFEGMQFDQVVQDLLKAHPILDQGVEGFDQSLINEVNDLHGMLTPKLGRIEAMRKAVEYVLGVEQAGAAPGLGERSPQDKAREERRVEGAKRTAAAVAATPKSPAEAPIMPVKAALKTPATMKDLNQMSEEDQARARGDYVDPE